MISSKITTPTVLKFGFCSREVDAWNSNEFTSEPPSLSWLCPASGWCIDPFRVLRGIIPVSRGLPDSGVEEISLEGLEACAVPERAADFQWSVLSPQACFSKQVVWRKTLSNDQTVRMVIH